MKKKITFKLWLTAFYKCIHQFLLKIAKLHGYKGGSTFGNVIWRILATCITLLLLMCTIVVVYAFCDVLVYREWIRPHITETVCYESYISDHIRFQKLLDKGRVYDVNLKKVIVEDVDSVNVYCDTLGVFAKNEKKGYFNKFTGEVVVPAIYTRAFPFFEDLAAVEKDNRLMFINNSGDVVIDKYFKADFDGQHYVFRGGYCVLKNAEDGKYGLIDKQGNWVLNPVYDNIEYEWPDWKVSKGDTYGMYSKNMELLVYWEDVSRMERYTKNDGDVYRVYFYDNTSKLYDFKKNELVDFVIDNVENMHYATTELDNRGGEETSEMDNRGDEEVSVIYAVARRQKYMVLGGDYCEYYGLINRNGKRITPPVYSSIEAIAEDLYLCKPHGIIINGKGQKIE